MSRGTIYYNSLFWLKKLSQPSDEILEIGSGAGLYKKHFGNLTCTDRPNSYYQSEHFNDVFNGGEALPFRSESFDLVFSQGAIDHIEEIEIHISEVNRVLTPKGKMLIFIYRKSQLEFQHSEKRNIKEGPQQHFHVFSEKEIVEKLTAAGFRTRLLPFAPKMKNEWIQKALMAPGIRSVVKKSRTWRTFLAEK
jgi:SAM-dependent methyltransferase